MTTHEARADQRLRVLVADDHPVFVGGIRALLSNMDQLVLVGETGTGSATVEAARDSSPDIILMDISMPDMNGIEATQRIRREHPAIKVLILTMHADDDTLVAAMRAGASGYLLKGAPAADIALAIEMASRGAILFGKNVAERVVQLVLDPPGKQYPFPELTAREQDVLELVAQGIGNATIAHKLGLSHKTVRNYMSRIFAKLRVDDRTAAAVRARRAGLGG